MQRSKQQALMFLLGAVLVGGVLGFSADRVISSKDKGTWVRRNRMYTDLGLSATQQCALDSLLDARSSQIAAVIKPVAPQIDSIRKAAHQQILAVFTPEQRAQYELRRAEGMQRDSVERARRDSIRAATKTTTSCR